MNVHNASITSAPTRIPGGGLLAPSFLALLSTQMLTAINDNVFRWLVIGIGKDYVDASQVSMILTAGTACFVLPYILLAAPAGYLADRFDKRIVIVACKIAEIVIMALGVLAIWVQNLPFLMTVVALAGAQSALFGPSKLGAIPELLHSSKISAANGLFGLTTVSATVIGMAIGNWLSEETGHRGLANLGLSAGVLLGIAVVGTLLSFVIRKLQPANPTRTFPWNAFTQTVRDLKQLSANRALLRVALGIVFFWSIGSLAQLNIDQFAAEGGAQTETAKIPLLVCLVFGVGFGSVLAGIWSGGRVELGILPLAAFGIAFWSLLLFTVQGTIIQPESAPTFGFLCACVFLFFLGTSAGLFSVPLEAYLQHRSPIESRGSILAAANFLTFTGVLCSALLFAGFRFPAYEGSLANVPANLRGEPLSAEQATRVQDAERDYLAAADGGESPAVIEDYLATDDSGARQALLARLLWIEFRQLRAAKSFVDRDQYFARFPDEKTLVKAVYDQAFDLPLLTSQQIFLVAGVLTVPVCWYIFVLIPQASIRFLVWLASCTVYRVKVYGRENLPATGGALLVANHVSWIDGVLLLMTSSRPIRMVAYSGNVQGWFMKWLARIWEPILIDPKPKAIIAALRTAREALKAGDLVCIFPEGGITRSGQLQAFKPGMMKILEGTDAPVVPVYLDGLWGSIFSFDRGKFFWKWPRRWPYTVSIYFGPPITKPDDVYQVRRVVQDLGANAVRERAKKEAHLVRNFIRKCKSRCCKFKIADSTGSTLTGGALLTKTLVLRRLFRRHVLSNDEQYVGVLLPPSLGGVVANMALSIDRRISVNLNYTVSSDVLNACIAHAGIKHVLTSRKFMEKMNFDLQADVVYLEDFKDKPTMADKLGCALAAYTMPAGMLARSLGAHKSHGDDVLTVIFTSGSTGTPKGVMLTHTNIASQVDAIDQVVHLNSRDVLVGVLPFFHSFGYTVTLWTVATLDLQCAYHYNPLDAKQVGKLCQKYKATIFLSTPTFLRTYLRRCDKEELSSLEVVVAGAEKLPQDLSDSFEEKFGVRPVEGYGATELSPLVSVNVPPSRSAGIVTDFKEGSVGQPVPGVSAKVIDLESGAELGVDQPGMLLITGPNLMQGYLGRDDLTNEAIRDGWYVTGDIAFIDGEGFIHITGRESRFSKIGGEMVPHIQIEETLARLIGTQEELKAAVTAVPDEKKGERLIVLHTKLDKSPEELRKGLSAAGLPNIFIPATDSFLEVSELPILGTGKLDLKGVKQVALEHFGQKKS